LSEDVILQIKNNSANIDPYLSLEYIEDGLSKSSTNWAELGSYIGSNKRLQHLDVDASVNEEDWEDVKTSQKFFDNIALNESIEHLILHEIGTEMISPYCLQNFTNLLTLKLEIHLLEADIFHWVYCYVSRNLSWKSLLLKAVTFKVTYVKILLLGKP